MLHARSSHRAAVEALFADMHAQIGRATIDRDRLHDLTDRAHALVMVAAEPGHGVIYEHLRRAGLGGKPAKLVEILAARTGKFMSRAMLLQALYVGAVDTPELKILDVYVCKARQTLRKRNIPLWIECSWGDGYRLVELQDGDDRLMFSGQSLRAASRYKADAKRSAV